MPKYVLNKSWHYIKGENTSLLKKDNIVTIVIFQVIHFPKKKVLKNIYVNLFRSLKVILILKI